MSSIVDGKWTVVRRRVSLAGHVVRGDGHVVSGGVVSLRHESQEPAATRGRGRADAKEKDSNVAKGTADTTTFETRIRPDGSYFYLDLPAGRYVTGGHDQGGGPIEAKAIDVPLADRTQLPPLLAVELIVGSTEGLPASGPS